MMSTDRSLGALWDICNDGWFFRATADQWWSVNAECPHGSWRAESNGAADLMTAFARLVDVVSDAH